MIIKANDSNEENLEQYFIPGIQKKSKSKSKSNNFLF